MKRFLYCLPIACLIISCANPAPAPWSLRDVPAGTVLSDSTICSNPFDSLFLQSAIDSALSERIRGKSYKDYCTVPLSELRYLKVLHKNLAGETLVGEMICSRKISDDLTEIFKDLYRLDYPIERMVLVDEYDADDDLSMEANNSSCFNYRTIANTTKISYHGLGLAVDINPKYNPYVKKVGDVVKVWPASSDIYVEDRDNRDDIPYLIKKGDPCYQAFISRGFEWGGEWTSSKDYQHFEKH